MDNNNVYSGELTHWGIKGMRWGIRRYQNKDGSLTPAGKKKLRAEQAKVREQEAINKKRKSVQASFDRLEARKKAAADEKKALDDAERTKLGKGKKSGDGDAKSGTPEAPKAAPKKKSIEEMTDEELINAISRAKLENDYSRLQPSQTQQGAQAVQSAQKSGFMKKMWDEAVVPAAIQGGKNLLNTAMSEGIKKMFKEPVDPNSVEALKKVYDKLDLTQKIDKIKNPDKYLSEEDKTKRADREYKAEDRAAKMRGYVDAPDEARAKREADAAAQKTKADNEARAANEAKSREYYDSTYSNKGGEKGYVNPNENRSLAVYNPPITSVSKSTISRGRSAVNQWDDGDYVDVTNDPTYPGNRSSSSSTIALGQRTIAGLLPAPKDDD